MPSKKSGNIYLVYLQRRKIVHYCSILSTVWLPLDPKWFELYRLLYCFTNNQLLLVVTIARSIITVAPMN